MAGKIVRLATMDAAETYVFACSVCGGPPEPASKLCRYCRRKRRAKTIAALFIGAELACLGVYLALPKDKPQLVVADTELSLPSPAPIHAATGWLYFDTQDRALGDVTHHARLLSNAPSNPSGDVHLSGVTSGKLELAASRTYGKRVVVTFPKVKTACEANPCELRAIFDNTQPERFPYVDGSDDQTTMLEVGDYDRFTQRLSVSHDLTLVASLGTPQDSILTFTVAGYQMAANGTLVIQLAARQPQAGRPGPG